MPLPLASIHHATRDALDARLFTPNAVSRVDAAFEDVPEGMSFYGFECRLVGSASQVDFGTGIAVDDGSRDSLADATRVPAAWAATSELCRAWRGSARLSRLMPAVFTEIDLDSSSAAPRVPSLFGRIDWPRRTNWTDELAEARRAAEEFLEVAHGAVAPAGLAAFGDCIDALPTNGWLHGIATMAGRADAPIRIGVWIPRWHLAEYLERIGLGTLQTNIVDLVGRFPDARGPFTELALDLTSSVSPRVGIEFTIEPEFGGGAAPVVLDRMVQLGAATAEKASALVEWPSQSRVRIDAVDWPVTVVRRLSHLKLVLEPGGEVVAKAYLTVAPALQLVRAAGASAVRSPEPGI